MRFSFLVTLIVGVVELAQAQLGTVSGRTLHKEAAVPYSNVLLEGTSIGVAADDQGNFLLSKVEPGRYLLRITAIGYLPYTQHIELDPGQHLSTIASLKLEDLEIGEVVVTGTMKEVSRLESPVPVEVYSPAFFKMNPTPTLYDAMQNVNGVRPQLNCNVCNTGDIHINGLEGPYTMILIDGMPIVSGLSSVYGLSGIPSSMIQRVEIVKGPASSLYGSEAVGGLINVITKDPANAPRLSADVMATNWQEYNIDLGNKVQLGNTSILTGLNYYNYSQPRDENGDNFTDVTLQDRISVFQKWNFKRPENRRMSFAARYLYEDRWGGEMQWTPEFRGGDSLYGESIYTRRWELIGNYQLPVAEKVLLSVSYNDHSQNSYYGNVAYMADQKIAFGQLTLDKKLGIHDLLAGAAFRYTYYDDNTPATAAAVDEEGIELRNQPDEIYLPGLFLQDDIKFSDKHKLLLGLRYDFNSRHGNIFTPRFAYKFSLNEKNIFRLNAGTGFRVVNLFTEDHASLTGARQVIIKEKLEPESSYNLNFNYIRKLQFNDNVFLDIDATVWHTYFTNQILPDYDTDPDKIIYGNLEGYAVTQGVSLNFDFAFLNGLAVLAGASYLDVFTKGENENADVTKQRPLLTEKWTGTWAISYPFEKLHLTLNYTGNLYGPMRLPRLGKLDPRPEYSPWWSIQNVQLTWRKPNGILELYGGVKNLLNFTPPKNSIARAHDPFDKKVAFDNPYALTFDPSYVFAPNQGIRGFIGLRVNISE